MSTIIYLLGAVLFLYVTWRNLRDDYKDSFLISYSWLALLGFWLSGRIGYGILNWGVWNDNWLNWLYFWEYKGFIPMAGYFGWMLVTWWYSNTKDWKVWYLFEDEIEIILSLVAIVSLAKYIEAKEIEHVVMIVVMIVVSFLSSWVKKKYRSFGWYKSGRKGFSFWFSNIILGLMMLLFSVIFGAKIWFLAAWGIWSLISMAGLVILGDDRRKK